MILEQFYLGCLSQASYLIGDAGTKRAAVVDPRRDAEFYVEEAKARGLELCHVFLTHVHADYVPGHLELRELTGATIHLGAAAQVDFPHESHSHGDEIRLGDVVIQVLETPGHTPDSTCLLVSDPTSPEPAGLLTGDTLFIGDVGRPDLMAGAGHSPQELAGWMYDSLHEKILPLPDETIVYPGHGAGSACGKSLSTETVSTLGEQRRSNYALQPMSREQFVQSVTAEQGMPPAYFSFAASLNRKNRETLSEVLDRANRSLSLSDALQQQAQGAALLDTRTADEFAKGHLPGALNVGLEGRYASWVGSVVSPEQRLVVIAPAGREREATLRLGRIGFDRVIGFLEGGADAWKGSDSVVATERVDAETLQQELRQPSPPLVLDVRNPGERLSGFLDESKSVPLGVLMSRLDEVPRDRRIVIHCATGYRSMVAASLLERVGYDDVADLVGGMEAWMAQRGAPTA